MSNIRGEVQAAITAFVKNQNDGANLPIDVLRVIEEEAQLMRQTQEICDNLDADPFEQLSEEKSKIESLKSKLQVTEFYNVRLPSHSITNAVVSIGKGDGLVQLTFQYERKPDPDNVDENGQSKGGSVITYTIDMAHGYGEKMKLLLVQVFAPSPTGVPSDEKAVCISAMMGGEDSDEENEESGGWEDIDDEDDNDKSDVVESINNNPEPVTISNNSDEKDLSEADDSQQSRKKQKTDTSPSATKPQQDNDEEGDNDEQQKEGDDEEGHSPLFDPNDTHDKFSANLDPEILHEFCESCDLLPMTEATGFFLLMTFPFYEHEWDLVGYVLDEVFGAGDDNDDDKK